MAVASPDRRARIIIIVALSSLFLIYFVKLTFPASLSEKVHTSVKDFPLLQAASGTSTQALATPSASSHIAPEVAAGSNTTRSNKVAIIIEDRPKLTLIPLILHFGTVLGPEWPIIIYTSSENVGLFSSSAGLQRHLKTGAIEVRILPSTTFFTNSDSVSSFLTKPWLWEDLAPVEHVLLFQSDSILCANSARSVDDFLEYDFVGAPIAAYMGGPGVNGGLSLRKRSTFLKIIAEFDWEKWPKPAYEDRWYYSRMLDLQNRGEDDIKLATEEIARTFAVETVDFPHPLGVHQAHRYIPKGSEMNILETWCPEVALCDASYIRTN